MLDVRRVLAPNPSVETLEGTNTWIVGRDPSIVIDPGPDHPGHLDEVAREASPVAVVLVTHDHPDHAPGARPFAERTAAPVHAMRLAGAERLRAGQLFRGGGVDLAVLPTPGHSSDHVAFFDEASGALFTGDAVLGRGTSFIDPPDGDLVRYLRSLHRMLGLSPKTIYPGHGPVVLRPVEVLEGYLAHRQEREDQILGAIVDEPRAIEAIVETVYADHGPEVYPLAARSVLAHLLKLEDEGRVERSSSKPDARWTPSTPRRCARCGRLVKGRARYCPSCSLAMLQSGG
ncbi:MAG TPA: MBL fold metallo-hydrolase [Actinomycetota bacterium]|nr:MBL fold metallo-hydrolase [Actinomycetota bacterium]